MAPLATDSQYEKYRRGQPYDLDQALFLLDGVSGDVRSYCGWSISAENGVAWTLNGDGSELLEVPTLLLRNVVSVVADGETLDVAEDIEWSAAGYLVKKTRWPCKLRSVVPTVDHGYEVIPPEIVTVVCSMVSRLSSTAGTGAATSVRIGDYAETRPNTNILTGSVGPDMPGASPAEQKILDRYRISLRP